MFIKKKNINESNCDEILTSICFDILDFNPDVFLIISKKLIELNGKTFETNEKDIPIVISSMETEELLIPSLYKLDSEGYLSSWCDEEPMLKIEYRKVKFIDGEINSKHIKKLYLEMEK